MKHLRLFNTVVDYESADIVKPNVSYVEENKTVMYVPNKEEIIEYHFEIPPSRPDNPFGFMGTIKGDFTDIFTEFKDFAISNGVYNEEHNTYIVEEQTFTKKYNITVNGIKTLNLELQDDYVTMELDAPEYMGGGSAFIITKTYIHAEHGLGAWA